MAILVLEIVALTTVVLSFGLAALVVLFSTRRADAAERRPEPPPALDDEDDESAAATMSRVLGEVERLAALRERGVLTAKEFTVQKTKLLQGGR